MSIVPTFLANLNLEEKDFQAALDQSKKNSISLLFAIENLNIIPEQKLLEAFANFYKVQYVALDNIDIALNIIGLIPKELAQKYRLLPISKQGSQIVIAIGDPKNLEAFDAIRFKTNLTVKPVLASEFKITQGIEKYYGSLDLGNIDNEQTDIKKSAKKNERISISGIGSDKEDGPIIKLVNDIMLQCMSRGASDIHLEPYENSMRIRLRIDGSLQEIAVTPANMKAPLTSRIKIMSGLNIAESRLPQDGAINITANGKPIDFRVSSLPTVYGEKIVMRILDKSNLQVDMTQLGFETDQLKLFKDSINKPHGMILVTGPTGSGKTTTLYSALQELNSEDTNIMTAEDPVEYNLPGINQVQMKSEIGLNFAASLRAFLRQDPDIIMVGEVRDLETAEIAIKAALTGHLVISTLHTNSASDTISRLLNMGVAGFNLVAALNCVTAQRLVRKICTRCKEEDSSITPQILMQLGIPESYLDKIKPMKGKGCVACGNSGNKGRIAVHEVLVMNEQIRDSVVNNQPAIYIKKIAIQTGMRTLRQSALMKLAQGIISAQEVLQATSGDGDH